MVVEYKPSDARNVPAHLVSKVPTPQFYTDLAYWQVPSYDSWGRSCFCYGGPGSYSWGWVMDDFGNATMSETNIHFGIFEAHHECH